MAEINVRPGPQDLLASLGTETYREAFKRGMSLSAYLEMLHPSDEYHDGLDAYSRLMKCAGIQTRSLPELGAHADLYERFYENDAQRALLPEWIARQWRRAASGRDGMTRGLYQSSDATVGGSMRPYIDAADVRQKQISPAIPLSELVAINTPINSDVYRAFYLTDVVDEERMKRVVEGTEVPLAKLTGGDNTITLRKYGRGLEVSYETLRRMRIDKVALHIARLAVQAEADKVASAISVLVSGDGNTNTVTAATSFNLTTLDTGATAGSMTLKAWLALKMKFVNPYVCTVALAQEAMALQLVMLDTGNANNPLVAIASASGFGGFRQINPGLNGQVGLGWTSDAPANTIVAVDTRFALEHVTEIGANIQEIEKFVTRQTQALVMTETEGFCIFDQNATKVCNVAA